MGADMKVPLFAIIIGFSLLFGAMLARPYPYRGFVPRAPHKMGSRSDNDTSRRPVMEVFAMGEYGPYVWSCFALTFIVVVLSDWRSRIRHRQVYR